MFGPQIVNYPALDNVDEWKQIFHDNPKFANYFDIIQKDVNDYIGFELDLFDYDWAIKHLVESWNRTFEPSKVKDDIVEGYYDALNEDYQASLWSY
jgi:hypothetical protein